MALVYFLYFLAKQFMDYDENVKQVNDEEKKDWQLTYFITINLASL